MCFTGSVRCKLTFEHAMLFVIHICEVLWRKRNFRLNLLAYFCRQQVFEVDGPAKNKEDLFHFIAYVPINGRLYELDGLREGPIDFGPCKADTWLNDVKPVIERRIQQYDHS